MRILDRYLARSLLLGWLGSTLLLAAVFSLFAFIEELDRTGAGGYDTLQATRYVLLSLPGLSMNLLPITVLLGSIFALATLARHNEIIAMRNAAISPTRLLRSAARPALLVMLLLWPVNEYLVAPLQQYAETARQSARSGSPVKLQDGGVWAVRDSRFYHVGRLSETLMPDDIAVYDFDAEGRLSQSLHAPRAHIPGAERRWRLEQAVSKQVAAPGPDDNRFFTTSRHEHRDIIGAWSREALLNLTLPHTAMPLTNLHNRIRQMRATGQDTARLEHVFWQRALLPVLVAAMVLLGTQLSTGMTDPRSHSLGRELGLGVAASLVFYIVSQIIYSSGLLLGLRAPVVAGLPILIALIICYELGRLSYQGGPGRQRRRLGAH